MPREELPVPSCQCEAHDFHNYIGISRSDRRAVACNWDLGPGTWELAADSWELLPGHLPVERRILYNWNERSNCGVERSFGMAAQSPTSLSAHRVPAARVGSVPEPADSRFDRRLAKILAHATAVFCEKGYQGASMRDLSRESGMSLAGMYYYFESKERLLYLIQRHTFTTILERLRNRLEGVSEPEKRIRVFIQNHLEYFLANQKAMKVLSHEDDVLKGEYGAEIAGIKREYYRICRDLMDAFKKERGLEFSSRIAVLSLFGMMNWIYTWHHPRKDVNASELAEQMGDIFLRGISGRATST